MIVTKKLTLLAITALLISSTVSSANTDDTAELLSMANESLVKNQYDQAYKYAGHAKALAILENRPADLAEALNAQGSALYHLSDFRAALDFHQQAYSIAQNTGDRDLIASTLSNIGNIHLQLNDFEAALITYEQVYQGLNQATPKTKVKILTNYGYTLHKNMEHEKALQMFQQAESILQKENLTIYKIYFLIMRGELAREAKEFKAALNYLNEALQLAEQKNNQALAITAKIELGTTLYHLTDYSLIIELLSPEVDKLKQLGKKDKLEDLHRILADSYRQLGEFEKALHHRESETKLQRNHVSLLALQHNNVVTAERKLENQQASLQALELSHTNKLKSLSEEFKQERYIYLAIIILLLITFIGYLLRTSHHNKES